MWGIADSPYGKCALSFDEHEVVEKLYFSHGVVFDGLRDDQKAGHICAKIFGGQPVEVSLKGSELEMEVWSELLKIGGGQTSTYSQIAQAIGRPRAVRAVASAIGRNEVSFLVPCHRVIRTDGTLGGYRWGIDIKQKLLNDEQKLK